MTIRRLLISLAVGVLLTFLARPASAQIVVDSVTNTPGPAANVTTLSWNHTVGSGANRILIVSISLRTGNNQSTGVTYGGTPLTLIGAQQGPGNQNRTEMWALLAAPTGTASVAVTLSGGTHITGSSISLSGVNQTTPFNTFVSSAGTSAAATVSAPSGPGQLVIDTVTANGDANTLTAGSGQTPQWNAVSGNGGASEALSGGSTDPGATPTVATSWTLGLSKPWSIGAVSLKPASSAPPNVTLKKSVSASASYLPGTDLAYTVNFSNGGGMPASSLTMMDPVPANTDFKLNSEAHSLGTTGLTVAVGYSNDGGTTWTYTPVSGGGGAPAGYDRNVSKIRWVFSGNLSQTSPNNNGSVSFTTRIR